MKNIIVVAKLKVKEEFLDEVYQELVKLHSNTHKFDDGCIQYDLHQDTEDKYSFTFVETWANQEALSNHEKKEHFISFVNALEDKLESLNIDKLKKLDI
ncbi:putative quinol monooxygenase [Halarcobacter sp.]|uniref:putative quinol monooxygenase n=1 Tax=Halarcobacter sp. TaxID=2321133 RepID=UPI003A8CD88D